MVSFVYNHSSEMFGRAKRINRADFDFVKLRKKFDFSWAPGFNDYLKCWELYAEAFESSRNAVPWPRDILMRLTDVARRDQTNPAYFSTNRWMAALPNPPPTSSP
eukprot:257179-Alexandrium_andersonii.AAC.1